jgi:hypothetical protein
MGIEYYGGPRTLNGLTGEAQTFAVASSGTDFSVASSGSVHTLSIPDASATARGLITTGTQTIAGAKTFSGAISASNLSNTNTGDNAVNSLYSGLVTNATHTGDATGATALTLATVNSNVGTYGSATQASQVTVNAKGLITAASAITITPAVGSITGMGSGVYAALPIAVGSAGAIIVNGGALGTPSSGVATNLTGTASGLTAGNVTTNANLTGEVTSVGNAATITTAAVTLAKMANVATGTVFYRKTAATGVPEVQTLATLKTDLGLTGTNSGDQTITLTGDVTGSGTGSFAVTIAAGAVALADMANMATGSLIYRKTALSGAPEVQTLATLKTDLGLTGTNSGDQDLSSYLTSATAASTYLTPATATSTYMPLAGGAFTGVVTSNSAMRIAGAANNGGDLEVGSSSSGGGEVFIHGTSAAGSLLRLYEGATVGMSLTTQLGQSDMTVNNTFYLTNASGGVLSHVGNQAYLYGTSINCQNSAGAIVLNVYTNEVSSTNFERYSIKPTTTDVKMGLEVGSAGGTATRSYLTGHWNSAGTWVDRMTLQSNGNLTVVGAIAGSNLSGTNTGDQDLSSYLTSATATSTYVPLTRTLNALALSSNQTFAVASTGTDFDITSTGTTHTFSIPTASATARGLLSTGTQTIAGTKTFTSTLVYQVEAALSQTYKCYNDTTGNGVQFLCQRARGTAAAPFYPASGDVLLGMYGYGYDENATAFTGVKANYTCTVPAAWTATSNGTQWTWATTDATDLTKTVANRMRLQSDGSLTLGSVVSTDGLLQLVGTNTAATGLGTATNRLRFTDTDNSVLANQPLGEIEFYSSDASPTAVGVRGVFGAYAESTTAATAFVWGLDVSTGSPSEKMRLTSAGKLGIGTGTTISAFAHVIGTTEQLRVGYDVSNYYTTTVSSAGAITFDAVGASAGFTFSDAVTLSSTSTATGLLTATAGVKTTKTIYQTTETTSTPAAGAVTIDLTLNNHQTLSLTSLASLGTSQVTFTPPTGSSAGTLIVKQHASASKDITTWAVTGGTIKWMGTEPNWVGDAATNLRVVSWRWDGSIMYLAATDVGT